MFHLRKFSVFLGKLTSKERSHEAFGGVPVQLKSSLLASN